MIDYDKTQPFNNDSPLLDKRTSKAVVQSWTPPTEGLFLTQENASVEQVNLADLKATGPDGKGQPISNSSPYFSKTFMRELLKNPSADDNDNECGSTPDQKPRFTHIDLADLKATGPNGDGQPLSHSSPYFSTSYLMDLLREHLPTDTIDNDFSPKALFTHNELLEIGRTRFYPFQDFIQNGVKTALEKIEEIDGIEGAWKQWEDVYLSDFFTGIKFPFKGTLNAEQRLAFLDIYLKEALSHWGEEDVKDRASSWLVHKMLDATKKQPKEYSIPKDLENIVQDINIFLKEEDAYLRGAVTVNTKRSLLHALQTLDDLKTPFEETLEDAELCDFYIIEHKIAFAKSGDIFRLAKPLLSRNGKIFDIKPNRENKPLGTTLNEVFSQKSGTPSALFLG